MKTDITTRALIQLGEVVERHGHTIELLHARLSLADQRIEELSRHVMTIAELITDQEHTA